MSSLGLYSCSFLIMRQHYSYWFPRIRKMCRTRRGRDGSRATIWTLYSEHAKPDEGVAEVDCQDQDGQYEKDMKRLG